MITFLVIWLLWVILVIVSRVGLFLNAVKLQNKLSRHKTQLN
jgi:hypothetical protein